MGLSSSQARLLTLTARMHQIEYKAAKLEAQKLQMANESKRVYDEYLDALELTKLQRATLDNNGSVKYVDTTYNDLCFNNGGKRFGLVAIGSGKPMIPENIASKYEENKFDPAAFATAMTGYVPTVIPEFGFNSTYTTPANAEEVPENNDISIAMGEAKTTTISDNTSGITLTLSNGLTTSGYTYNIKSKDGSAQDVTFQYLNNGRLVVFGDNLEIVSNGSQNDDIILLGNNNKLNAGAGDDIIRVGYTLGQNPFKSSSTGNEIIAGAGRDHIVLGNEGNSVSGVENLLSMSTDIESGTSISGLTNPWAWYQSSGVNSGAVSQSADVIEGPASQGSVGDCRLFSLINSLGKNTNNGNLSNYVDITKSGSNYNVTFKKYTGANKTATISEAEVQNTQNVTGDLTTILIDLALNKLMDQNGDDPRLASAATTTDNAFSRADYNTVSKYFFGNSKIDWATTYSDFQTQYSKYSNPSNTEYTNLIVGFKTSNEALGIVSGHAYSVKNVTSNYVEVVNPWDDADVLRLSMSDFQVYYDHSYVFGAGSDTMTYQNTASATDNTNNGYVISDLADGGASDTEWYYFFNLHQKIANAGGYELINPENSGRTDYITNLISGGYAYLVEFDAKTNSFADTSVAINTSLREVADESLLRKAEAKYEADMRKIDAKDRRYDHDLAAIEQERNAIKSEMETLKTVAKDNVERTFKLFS